METLLNGIQAECVELNFCTCQGHVVELAGLLVAYFRRRRIMTWKKLRGSVSYDFFNKMLLVVKRKVIWFKLPKALIEAIQPLPFYRVLNVNAISLNNAELTFLRNWAMHGLG